MVLQLASFVAELSAERTKEVREPNLLTPQCSSMLIRVAAGKKRQTKWEPSGAYGVMKAQWGVLHGAALAKEHNTAPKA
jgi:hypothetical protein